MWPQCPQRPVSFGQSVTATLRVSASIPSGYFVSESRVARCTEARRSRPPAACSSNWCWYRPPVPAPPSHPHQRGIAHHGPRMNASQNGQCVGYAALCQWHFQLPSNSKGPSCHSASFRVVRNNCILLRINNSEQVYYGAVVLRQIWSAEE